MKQKKIGMRLTLLSELRGENNSNEFKVIKKT